MSAEGPPRGANYSPSGGSAAAKSQAWGSKHVNANLYTLFEDHFEARVSPPCVLIPKGRVVHYDELAALSARIAHALVRVGCRQGDRVAAQVDKHWHALALYLACLRAGLVYLPLNVGYQKAEFEALGVNFQERTAVVLTLDSQGGELLDRAADAPEIFDTVVSRPDDLAAIVYTSGTTGRSKGAMLSHRNLAANALALVEHWGFTRGDVLLHALPIYHVHGLFVATHCTLLSGCRMLWLAKFDAKETTSLLPSATVMMGVPTYYTRLLAEPSLTREASRSIRLFVSGSAPLLPETFDAFRARTGHAILERYGMTETGMITSNPLEGPRVAGTVGKPLSGEAVRVVDATGAPCPPGTIGHIEVKGPNVFSGYWRMPDKTREEFSADGYFKTGDMGEWVASDEGYGYLRLVGRAKDLIITGGLNVYPLEVEERIDSMDGVVESAVIGLPDHDLGEAVAAVVVPAPGHALTERAIIGALRDEIATFKVPKRVFFADDLPRNAMGKVQKKVLRSKYSTL